MKTTLTSKNLEILYNMACQMAPFNNLPMPKSNKVRFKVIKDPTIYGCFDEHEMEIQISSGSCGYFTTIFQTLLHEMVHLALYVRGDEVYTDEWDSFKNFGVWGAGGLYLIYKLDFVHFVCYNAVMN
jgi:hypothetical protein